VKLAEPPRPIKGEGAPSHRRHENGEKGRKLS
jgi:hypothetical protein